MSRWCEYLPSLLVLLVCHSSIFFPLLLSTFFSPIHFKLLFFPVHILQRTPHPLRLLSFIKPFIISVFFLPLPFYLS